MMLRKLIHSSGLLCLLVVLFVLLPVVACADVPIDAEHFPDPTFRTYVFNYFDSNRDGALSEAEIKKIGSIDLTQTLFWKEEWLYGGRVRLTYDRIWYVTSLKGIEYFTSLRTLNCKNNGLTYLDLSQNEALVALDCSGNRITNLNLGNKPYLQSVKCYCNLISILNLSGCTALTTLNCDYNLLTSLNLNNNPNLAYLYCSHNRLEKLDVSKNLLLEECQFYNFNEYSFARFYYNKKSSFEKRGELTLYGLQFIPNAEYPGRYYVNVGEYVPNITSYYFRNVSYDWFYAKFNGESIYIYIDKDNPWHGLVDVGERVASKGNNWIRFSYGEGNGDVIEGCTIEVHDSEPPTDYNNEPPAPQALNMQVDVIDTRNIICDIDNGTYLDKNGQPLNEESIADYSYSDRGVLGIVADGNSRLIIRIKSNKPGYASFSSSNDMEDVRLESLTDRKAVGSGYSVKTTEIGSGSYQASVILVAPETFPSDKKFPYDKFSLNVSFMAEDEEVDTERYYGRKNGDTISQIHKFPAYKHAVADIKTIELKIAAAPVLLIPGMFDNADETFGISRNTGVWWSLKYNDFDETHIDFWDYDGSKGPNELLAEDYNELFHKLNGMFAQYASAGIVCTKADIVAHGMGGLMARKFLAEERKDSQDGNNWSVRSYKQGMVRRLITIATPHRGTPWADTPDRAGTITTIYNSILSSPYYDNHPVLETILKPFTLLVHTMLPSPQIFQDAYLKNGSAWAELKTTTARNYGFPANVPMFAITGNIQSDSFIQDIWTPVASLIDKRTNINLDVSNIPSFMFSWSEKMLSKWGKTLGESTLTLEGWHAAKKLKLAGRACGIFAFLYDLPSYARIAVDCFASVIFGGVPHDMMVSYESATGDFGSAREVYYNTISELINNLDRYSHWSICQQVDVGATVSSLLKNPNSIYRFTVFDKETPEGNRAQMLAAEHLASENDPEDFEFNETLRLNVKPRVLASAQTVKFTVISPKKLNGDVYCTIGSGDVCRFFKLIDADGTGRKFQAELDTKGLLVSVDAGVLEVQCFSLVSDNSGMYTSNTVNVGWLTDAVSGDEDTPPVITTSSIKTAIRKKSFSLQLKASGTSPIIWTYIGKLPAGLKLSTSGKISGTPTKAGSFTFTVKAENAGGENTRKFKLKVTQTTLSCDIPETVALLSSYKGTLEASGGIQPYTWSINDGVLPEGLKLDEKAGTISGKPTKAGTYTFKVKVTDANKVIATKSYTVTITAPSISGTLPDGILKSSYSGKLSASGGTSPYVWTVNSGDLPSGLTLNESTGELSGTPGKSGTYKFEVKVTDKNKAIATKSYTIKITAPSISGTLSDGIIKASYSKTLKASGGTAPYTWTKSSGTLPTGLTLNKSTGKLLGTPTKAGKFTFKVKVTDKNKATATKSYTVTITAPSITGTLSNGVTKALYSGTLSASGGTSPYTWTVNSGDLPSGLTLNKSTGKLSGTPGKAGMYKFEVKVTDKNKAIATKSYTIKITAPSISGTLSDGIIKASYSKTLKASGGTAPYTWTKSSGTLPTGLTLNKLTGKLSGTPSKAGKFTFKIKLTDKNKASVTKAYTVTITSPAISGTLKAGTVNKSYSGTLKASGGTSPYTWTVSKGNLPSGLTLNKSKGTITGTPKKAGKYSFTVKITDKNKATAMKTYTITVKAASSESVKTNSWQYEELYEPESDDMNLNADGEKLTSYEHNVTLNVKPETHIYFVTELHVMSDDVLFQGTERDEDIVSVRANEPVRFILGTWPLEVSYEAVCIDDEVHEEIEIHEGTFIIPAELVHDDFKVCVKAKTGEGEYKLESEELYISAEE